MPRHLLRRQPASIQARDQDLNPNPDTDSSRTNRGTRPAHTHTTTLTPSQFQTPPQRGTGPSSLQPPRLHPSSGLVDFSPTAALYSLFGRGVSGRRQHVEMMDEDDAEEQGEEEEEEDNYDGGQAHVGDELSLLQDVEEGEGVEDEEEMVGEEIEEGDGEEGEVGEEEGDEDQLMRDRDKTPSPLPTNLREISSLASWTVSTHKPGCGVAALRHPSPEQYWQSDGPQPHTLTLHFFKLVAVVKIRVYLDFELDESYTPTKMIFLAGMGGNDLVEFATWEGEGPCGWVDIPLEGVGGRSGGWVSPRRARTKRRRRRKRTRARDKYNNNEHSSRAGAGMALERGHVTLFSDHEQDDHLSEDDTVDEDAKYDEEGNDDDLEDMVDDSDDPYAGSVLKAMVIQMRVIENHQNGKDTHVRGFQVFARDDDRRRMSTAPSASASCRRRQSVRRSFRASTKDAGHYNDVEDIGGGAGMTGLEEPDWMGEPVIR